MGVLSKKRFRAQQKLLDRVRERYPTIFDQSRPLPLKLGVDADLAYADRIDPSAFEGLIDDPQSYDERRALVKDMLRIYTNRFPYHMAIVKNENRFDLDGNPVSEIAAFDQSRARGLVASQRRLAQETKKREKQKAQQQKANAPAANGKGAPAKTPTPAAKKPAPDKAPSGKPKVRPRPATEVQVTRKKDRIAAAGAARGTLTLAG